MRVARIVLADDHREMIEKVLSVLEGKFDVVATVENGQRMLDIIPRLEPDVLVLDISMPILDGIKTARRLKAFGSKARVIFLTAYEDHDFVTTAISVGALGYVVKSRLMTDLVPAIQSALQGQFFCSPCVTHK